MGKGVIVSGGLDGLYQVRLELDRARVDARIAEIDARLESDLELVIALNVLNDAEAVVDDLSEQINRAILEWDTLQTWSAQEDYPTGAQFGNEIQIPQFGASAIVVLPGRSGDDEPDWASIGDNQTIRENAVTWSMSVEDQTGGNFWASSNDYELAEKIIAIPNIIVEGQPKHVYATVTQAGHSGDSVPPWTESGTVIDGGIIWRRRNQAEEISRLVVRLAEASGERDKARGNYDTLRLEREQLRRQKDYLQSHMPDDPEVSAWCADITENLAASTEVGTVEIPGERNGIPVKIRPGYGGAAVYDATRDGKIQPTVAGTKFNTFWNWAMRAGWQKWRPQYRLGAIVSIDYEQQQCSVLLDAALSSDQELNVNQDGATPLLFDVPIVYMTCNARAFVEGDRVVVEFVDRDWTQPRVIGFESNPRRCPSGRFSFAWNQPPVVDRMFFGGPGNWEVGELSPGNANQLANQTRFTFWHSGEIVLSVDSFITTRIYLGLDKVATAPGRVMAAGLNRHSDNTMWLRAVVDLPTTSLEIDRYEKPWPATDPNSAAIFDQTTYDDLIAVSDFEGALAEWAKWHLIGEPISILDDITDGANPAAVPSGSINAAGTEYAGMIGFIYPNVRQVTVSTQITSEWHGYIKINLDTGALTVIRQMPEDCGLLSISASWSNVTNGADPSLGVDGSNNFGYDGACAAVNSNSVFEVSDSKTESQHGAIIVDVAYEGSTLYVGEIELDYDYSTSQSQSESKIIQATWTPDPPEEPTICKQVSHTTSHSGNSSGSSSQTGQLVARIRPENNSTPVLEVVIEDYTHTAANSSNFAYSGHQDIPNLTRIVDSVSGSISDTASLIGQHGFVEYLSVKHRCIVIMRWIKTHTLNSAFTLMESETSGDLFWQQTTNENAFSGEGNQRVIYVPGHEQVLNDPKEFESTLPWFPQAVGYTPFGSGANDSGNDEWSGPLGEGVLATHYADFWVNALGWNDFSPIANTRYIGGASFFSIDKFTVSLNTLPGSIIFELLHDESTRYTFLTDGDPAALLEASPEDQLRLQQIGIL